jgi:hypothetical protein
LSTTGNAAAVVEILAPHVNRVVIANPKQVRLIAHAKINTDTIDAAVLAKLYATGFLPEVWISGRTHPGAPPAGGTPHAARSPAGPAEEPDPVHPA